MKSGEFIQRKLQAWARRKDIPLQGSAGEKGEPNYTARVEQNVFGGALLLSVKHSFDSGAGGELRGKIPAISALHSSAALAVNLFQYWVKRRDLETLAALLDIPSRDIENGEFEGRFPVCEDWQKRGFREPPHLDFAFRYAGGARVGIECKLFEPFGRIDRKPLSQKYLDLPDAWHDIPAWRTVAEQLAVTSPAFHRLDVCQLVKHILGLKFCAPASKVRLVYLYFDALGSEAAEHREEIQRFKSEIDSDPVRFVPITVQEFITRAIRLVRDDHVAYVDYLGDRYL